MKIPILILAAF